MEYGRIAAQAAKQVIIQRIQEAERDVMYDTFKDRENELLNALIHRVDNQQVYVNLDNKITTMLPPDQQIPHVLEIVQVITPKLTLCRDMPVYFPHKSMRPI